MKLQDKRLLLISSIKGTLIVFLLSFSFKIIAQPDLLNVMTNGNVGIGTTTPLYPLDISAGQGVMRMISTSHVNGSVIELKNIAGTPTFLGAINFNNSAGTFPGQIAYKPSHEMSFRVEGSNRLTISKTEIIGLPRGRFFGGLEGWNLASGNATNIAIFGAAGGASTNWAGYFGVGNVYMADELRIGSETGAAGYKVSVKGKVMCEELKVQLQGNWPDYVFNDNYQLASLDQLKSEIKRTGHLPGIPSAVAVQKNGIEVGEMQRLLLEKIEELTLYVIGLKEENERQETEISFLKSKFN